MGEKRIFLERMRQRKRGECCVYFTKSYDRFFCIGGECQSTCCAQWGIKVDEENNQYNLEIQVAENENHLRRSRFIQSRIDSRCLGTGLGYEELPELYLIFITEKDFLHIGEGIAEIARVIKQKGQQTDNGVHEIYANLEQPVGDERKQRLLSFIKDTNNADIPTEGFENLVARVRYLKSEEGGIRFMCNVIERERAEGYAEGKEEGSWLHLIRLTMKKKEKGMEAQEIADLLEEDETTIERIFVAADLSKSEDVEKVYECMEENAPGVSMFKEGESYV